MTSPYPDQLLYNLPVRRLILLAAMTSSLVLNATPQSGPGQITGSDANLRGVSISKTSSGKYATWVSGTKGTILRSLDIGKSWKQLHVADGTDLDFRDIESFGKTIAYVMSSGEGGKSRIYKTSDGGQSWARQYTGQRAGFFLDAIACREQTHCFALSDPVDGKFVILSTIDGQHWTEFSGAQMPAALPTEGAFAASGTSIVLCGKKDIYFGTGGPAARVFHSADEGHSWTATATPMASGNASSGIFSLACQGRAIVAVGGDYREPDNAKQVAIYSADAGTTWHLAEQQPGGYRSAVTFISGHQMLAVGTNGSDISPDDGVHWTHRDSVNLNAIGVHAGRSCTVGPKGAVFFFGKP